VANKVPSADNWEFCIDEQHEALLFLNLVPPTVSAHSFLAPFLLYMNH
jgi:hypothetical protein